MKNIARIALLLCLIFLRLSYFEIMPIGNLMQTVHVLLFISFYYSYTVNEKTNDRQIDM